MTIAHRFDDGAAYEQFMGRWSRALGQAFLAWAAPPEGARWLDVGCGTGIFTELIFDACSPAAVVGIDSSRAQIEHARQRAMGPRVDFRVADAQALPLLDASFDVVASALAINFIPDRPRALSEMRRVARLGGLVAACVWDFAAELSPSWPLRRGMRRIGANAPPVAGTHDSSLDALASLFHQAGLEDIATSSIDVRVAFDDFDDFWRAQTPHYAPTTDAISVMTRTERATLIEAVRTEMAVRSDDRIEYSARANALRARSPA
jgi:ubiquinone/menaquinone biosynthesis C-methylase UbiE